MQKVETQKNLLINDIATMNVNESTKNLDEMDKKSLKLYIKKLLYRIKDLEAEKLQCLRRLNKNKESDLEKYKKMLIEIRQVK